MFQFIRYSTFVLILAMTYSCVTMQKFSAAQGSSNKLLQDSIKFEEDIKSLNDKIDDLTIKNISLGTDTIRLYSRIMDMSVKYEREIEDIRYDLGRLNSQSHGSSKKDTSRNMTPRVSKIANSISKSVSMLGGDIKTILWNNDARLYNVKSDNWELSINLRDTLLFPTFIESNGDVTYDYSRLTKAGNNILTKIASIVVKKDNYNVIVKKTIYINSPNLEYIPVINDDLYGIDSLKIMAFIDTMINNGLKSHSTVSAVDADTIKIPNNVIDIIQSNKLDSINDARLQEEIINKEIVEALKKKGLEIKERKDKAKRKLTDPTTTIARKLMKYSYDNLEGSKISREISYIKAEDSDALNNRWIEIVLKPNIEELYIIIKEIQNNKKLK